MANAVLEPATVTFEGQPPEKTFSLGIETAKLIDMLALAVHGKKRFEARDWRRKYGKFEKKEVSQ